MEKRNNINNKYEIPPCDTQGLFFHDSANIKKPKLLIYPNSLIDNQSVFKVLQFSVIVPFLSPWKGIRKDLLML